MDQAKEAWGKMSESGLLLKENSFTQQVSQRVLNDSGVKAKMADKQMINLRAIGIGAGIGAVAGGVAGGFLGGGWGAAAGVAVGAGLGGAIGYAVAGYDDVTPERLSELLHLTSRLDPGTFFNIFARMVHDKLNREGVEVTNGEDTWKLSGDETLNADSLRVGQKAVAETEKNLEEAATTPGDLPYDEMIGRVWKLVPHPTDSGQKFIGSVRDELTNAAHPAAVDEAVKLSVREIDTAIDQMIEMGILRQKPGTTAATPSSGGGGGAPPASEGAGGGPGTPATSGAEGGPGGAAPDRVPATTP
jgi:outer membrane lipoprotein SlyB